MAVKAPPIKSPFVPLRHPDGPVSADMLRQNLDRIAASIADLHAKIQVNYVALPSPGGGAIAVNGGPVPLGPDIYGDSTGAETVVLQWLLDSGAFGASLTFALNADFLSSTGTAVFRLRIGGADRAADGTVVLARSQPATGLTVFSANSVTSLAASPGGLQRLKLTVQSSAALAMAQIKDGFLGVSS